jgi:hypothetical protein
MSPKQFLLGLIYTSLIQLGVSLLLLWWILPLRAHFGFIISSMLALIVFCVMMYGAAYRIARSPLTRLYIQLIMIAVFLKMLLCLALIIGYKKGFDPADNSFIWPFLVIYVTSTVYEVIFLEKVGRQKQPPFV